MAPPVEVGEQGLLDAGVGVGFLKVGGQLKDAFIPHIIGTFGHAPKHMGGVFVSGSVVRPTDETHTRCITNNYLRMKHDRGRCNDIGIISRSSLNKSSLFRYFILYVV